MREEVKSARENVEALPTHLLREASNLIPQTFWKLSVKLMAKAPDWMPGASWNVVVANVRGPVRPLDITGARAAGLWPVAFLTPGVGLNVTLRSYTDRLCFGFMGCPDLLADLSPLPGYLVDALGDLAAASGVLGTMSERQTTTRPPAPGELVAGAEPDKERQ